MRQENKDTADAICTKYEEQGMGNFLRDVFKRNR